MPVAERALNQALFEQYNHAFKALSDNDPQTEELFDALATRFPDDPLVKLHARRIESGESGSTLVIRKK